jgi:hypothetical protein
VTKRSSLQLDLFDKDSIKTATVDLAKMIDERERELAELRQKYDQLRAWAGYPASGRQKKEAAAAAAADAARAPSIQDEVVRVLTEQHRPMNTMEVVVHLGTGANRKTVNWAMWNAEREGLIQRLPDRKGFYAALDYKPSTNGDGAGAEAEYPLSRDSAAEAGS